MTAVACARTVRMRCGMTVLIATILGCCWADPLVQLPVTLEVCMLKYCVCQDRGVVNGGGSRVVQIDRKSIERFALYDEIRNVIVVI